VRVHLGVRVDVEIHDGPVEPEARTAFERKVELQAAWVGERMEAEVLRHLRETMPEVSWEP
jgi:hypothetical protein